MRRALLVGINAYPTAPLRGCLADVESVERILGSRQFDRVDCLRDQEATTAALKNALRLLLDELRPGDTAFFSYSGHGAWTRDLDGDEPDGQDEMLVPYDFAWERPATHFTDDRIARVIAAANVPAGVRIVLNLDCCHAGTMTRFMYGLRNYRTFPVPFSLQYAPARTVLGRARAGLGLGLPRRTFGTRVTAQAPGAVLLLAATRPAELAADATIAGSFHGAHTYALEQALAETPSATYRDLKIALGRFMDINGYAQTPTLYGARALRTTPFLA